MKNKRTNNTASNYRPATRLALEWNLFAEMHSESIYEQLDNQNLMLAKQKCYRKNLRETHDLVYINKADPNEGEARAKNLIITGIDYRISHDMVTNS